MDLLVIGLVTGLAIIGLLLYALLLGMPNAEEETHRSRAAMVTSVIVGAAIGGSLGIVAMGNIGLGVALGVSLGMVVGKAHEKGRW